MVSCPRVHLTQTGHPIDEQLQAQETRDRFNQIVQLFSDTKPYSMRGGVQLAANDKLRLGGATTSDILEDSEGTQKWIEDRRRERDSDVARQLAARRAA
ncbi:hypothetical protein OOT46_08880 [Aquabacterium sp. A7-Y]|uniref:hypothetical protein n=1 Tax=Aquabacterium sp. A7-Y TaxID=1349605 RepID=UPI00223D64CC|nr:hypothetical protein [Aquabacterium sp. A7-Y]MCW7537963.1 hypothetical protein [Aquabacterium sp. A7-Y]